MSFLYSHVLTRVKTGNMVSGGVTFFKHFQGYSEIPMHIQSLTGTQRGGAVGETFPAFF